MLIKQIVLFFSILLYANITMAALGILEIQQLKFCKTVPDQAGGIVEKNLWTLGCTSIAGSHTFSTTGTTGQFRISGTAFSIIDVTFTDGSLTGSGNTINLNNFNTSISTFILNPSGYVDFSLAAQVDFNSSQIPDTYLGTYTINYKNSGDTKWNYYTANAEIEILPIPIVINQQDDMFFDEVAGDTSGGTIRLNTDNSIENVSGNSTFLGSAPSSATFSVDGSPNSSVSVSFTNGTLTGTGDDISLHNFNHDGGGSPVLDGNGNLILNVGGDLNINANQAVGSYSGIYTIEINY